MVHGSSKSTLASHVFARALLLTLTVISIAVPFCLIIYQSLLSGPFFVSGSQFSLGAFDTVIADPDFWKAFRNSLLVATGMLLISVPIGTVFAFLIARTDIPHVRFLEILMLLPMLIPSIILGFGYIVTLGPVGFISAASKATIGYVPWNVYSPFTIVFLASLAAVPYVFLYVSTALRNISSDVEEAARSCGSSPWGVALKISIPMVAPAIVYSAVFIFFIGIELFGLVLSLGAPSNFDVLSVYLYKLTNRLGLPSYHLMAAVVIIMLAITFPLVFLQRRLLKSSHKFVSVKGKQSRSKRFELNSLKWPAYIFVMCWAALSVFIPIAGILLRSLLRGWGEGTPFFESLTFEHIEGVLSQPPLLRGIINSASMGVLGGLLAVVIYLMLALATRRQNSLAARTIDYLCLIPRATPGIAMGLAFLWMFLFIPYLSELRSTLFSLWLAYAVVWLAYGLRLFTGALSQLSPELTEAARICGSNNAQATHHITLPLLKGAFASSWLLIFLMFVREYSTGVYLIGGGTELIGPMLINLLETGAMEVTAALSVINIFLIGTGLAVALSAGAKVNA